MKIRIARIAAIVAAAIPLTLGGAAFAQASQGEHHGHHGDHHGHHGEHHGHHGDHHGHHGGHHNGNDDGPNHS